MTLRELFDKLAEMPEPDSMEVTIESSRGEYEPQSIENIGMTVVAGKTVIVLQAH